jgi:hypothetical protein
LQDWEDPQEFLGCGKFTADSWRIFCRGHRSLRDVEDATLKRYLRWLTKGVLEEKEKPSRANAKAAGALRGCLPWNAVGRLALFFPTLRLHGK